MANFVLGDQTVSSQGGANQPNSQIVANDPTSSTNDIWSGYASMTGLGSGGEFTNRVNTPEYLPGPEYQRLNYTPMESYSPVAYEHQQYAGANPQAEYVRQLQAQLGIQGPADIRQSQYDAINSRAQQALAGIDTGLAGRGITGGGIGSAQNRAYVKDTLLPAYAGIESNYANQLSDFQNRQQQLANAYGQQLSGFNAGEARFGHQSDVNQAQYGYGSDLAQNQFGYQANLAESQAAQDWALGERERQYERNLWNPFQVNYDFALNADKKSRNVLAQAGY